MYSLFTKGFGGTRCTTDTTLVAWRWKGDCEHRENSETLIIKDIYLDNSNIDEKILDELLLKDSWLTSSQSLKYGLIDEIL